MGRLWGQGSCNHFVLQPRAQLRQDACNNEHEAHETDAVLVRVRVHPYEAIRDIQLFTRTSIQSIKEFDAQNGNKHPTGNEQIKKTKLMASRMACSLKRRLCDVPKHNPRDKIRSLEHIHGTHMLSSNATQSG